MTSSPVIDLTDAKLQLNIPASDTSNDAEIMDYVLAASDVAAFYCGDLVPQSYTEVHDGGDAAIYLRHTPVQSIQTLTEYIGNITYTLTNQPPGQSVDAWGYSLDDPDSGRVVRRTASGIVFRFVPGYGNVAVTYTAGSATVPSAVQIAVRMIVQYLWRTQQGASPLPVELGDNESTVPGVNYGIPNDAIVLLQSAARNPVIS